MSTQTETPVKVEIKFSKYENVLKAFITAQDNTLTPVEVGSASESNRTPSKVISSLKVKYNANITTKKDKNKIISYTLKNADELKTTVVNTFETKRTENAEKEAERKTKKSSSSNIIVTPLPIEEKPLVNPYKSDEHAIQLREITPQEAHEILSWYNANNRPITKARVDTYVQAIKDGKWAFNGDPIRFKQNGSLLDAQHRLTAIYKSGIAQKFVFVLGLDDYAFTTMDYGKTRNGADVLYIAEKDNDTNPKALVGLTKVINSSLQWVEAYSNNLTKDKPECLTPITTKNYDILDLLKNHRTLVESAKFIKTLELNKTGNVKLGLNKGQVAFIHYETSKINKTLSSKFLNQVFKGIGVEENSVADILRQFLIKNKQEKKSHDGGELIRRVIIAWDRLVNDSKLTPKSLQSNSQKLYPTFSKGNTEER